MKLSDFRRQVENALQRFLPPGVDGLEVHERHVVFLHLVVNFFGPADEGNRLLHALPVHSSGSALFRQEGLVDHRIDAGHGVDHAIAFFGPVDVRFHVVDDGQAEVVDNQVIHQVGVQRAVERRYVIAPGQGRLHQPPDQGGFAGAVVSTDDVALVQVADHGFQVADRPVRSDGGGEKVAGFRVFNTPLFFLENFMGQFQGHPVKGAAV